MTNLFSRILLRPLPATSADLAYAKAMNKSDALLKRMLDASQSRDAARGVMADIWQQRHNIPFMVTVHEAISEMKAPLDGDTAAHPPPRKPDQT